MIRLRRALGPIGLALALSTPALAEPAPAPETLEAAAAEPERPWAAGVSAEHQQRALALFHEGNALFTESEYAAALGRYREALLLWKHPAIHYNAAVSLINLEQPLAAYEQIEAALAYGEAPLGADNHRQAELYRKLLFAQIAELEVSSDQPGVQVTLDGTALFVAPGSVRRRLAPGAHQLVARKAGLLTDTHALDLPAGKLTRATLTLSAPPPPALHSVRRWATWKPWTVLGSGVALGAIGVPFLLSARNNFATYDAEVARLCPTGCDEHALPPTVIDARERGSLHHAVAVGLFAAGGAVTATGITLVFLNQPRVEPVARPRALSLTPHVNRQFAGITATFLY